MCEKQKSDGENSELDDTKPRSYYYDDAHGYEDFDPESDEMEPDEDEESA
ncbi:MAG: hypothetical protein PSX80_03440 [bacterium]|nr:hypothetical protein [bacterium]